jgi:hypothetical protein
MPVSDIEVVKPSDLDNVSAAQASGDDFIIREQASDNQVLSQRVKDLLGIGPFTYFIAVLGGATPTITASTSSILNLSANAYNGMFDTSEWYPGTNPESIVIPGDGRYIFFVLAEVNGGTTDGQAYVNLVQTPAGTPSVIGRAALHTAGMGEDVSTSFTLVKELYQGDEIGIQFVNDGLADYTVNDTYTTIIVVKIG